MAEAVETISESKAEKKGVGQFVGEVREELERTTFPSRDEVRNTTLIVIANVIFFAIFLFLVDQGWALLLTGLQSLINR